MFKKIILGSLLIGLIAILVIGAANRTNARVENTANGGGQHSRTAEIAQAAGGRGAGQATTTQADGAEGQRSGRWAQATTGGGRGGGQRAAGAAPQAGALPANWLTVTGKVVSVASELVEIETAAGAVITFEGQPLKYALGQGFSVKLGDAVAVSGYDEDGEFKIGQAVNLTTGASVTLRDASGRPGWSGTGRGRNR